MVVDIGRELDVGGAEVVAGTLHTRAVPEGDGHIRAEGPRADAARTPGCREVGGDFRTHGKSSWLKGLLLGR
jgi:hypothetical protein